MALTILNKYNEQSAALGFGNKSKTIQYSVSGGSNLCLFVGASHQIGSGTPVITGVTYDGVSMSTARSAEQYTLGGNLYETVVYKLQSPNVGTNLNLVINYSNDVYDKQSYFVFYASDCGGVGSTSFETPQIGSGHTGTINSITTNSYVYVNVGWAGSVINSITIDGVTKTSFEYTHNINDYSTGVFSDKILTSGNKTISVITGSGADSNGFLGVEILDSGSVQTRRRIMITQYT